MKPDKNVSEDSPSGWCEKVFLESNLCVREVRGRSIVCWFGYLKLDLVVDISAFSRLCECLPQKKS